MKKPKVKFIGADGNVFNLMGLATRAMRSAGQDPKPMLDEVRQQTSYDMAIVVMMKYVDVR